MTSHAFSDALTQKIVRAVERKDTRVSLLVCVLYFCAGTSFSIHSSEGAAAAAREAGAGGAIRQTIVIHGDKDLGPSRLRQGFVHGVTYEAGRDYSKTIALIMAVRPMSWRLSTWANVYGFVVGEAELPQRLGTNIVVNVQDMFNLKYGFEVKTRTVCLPWQNNCFSSYDAFKMAWLEVVNAAIRNHAEKRLTVDYIDVFAEPDYGAGKLGISPEQLGDIFKSTHDAIRQYRPDAKIVAPSFSAFRAQYLKRFVVFVAENNLRLDALSWHEFEAPDIVPSHVSEMREFMKTQPKVCNPKCPEIHINEYAPEEQHFVPGYGVAWLYYLEKARVDHANRACWDLPRGESTCWAGFNGLLSQDNVTPNAIYWVYKAYADMTGSRLFSDSSLPQTVALASNDESKREIRILVGKFGQRGTSGSVAINGKGFRYSVSSAIAEITRIPDSMGAERSLRAPPPPRREVIQVHDNSFSLVIPDFRDGDAYSIVVRPAGESSSR